MKIQNVFILAVSMFLAVSRISSAERDPEGFDPETLAKVLSGKIVQQQVISTPVELRTMIRAYFDRVSGYAYIQLATDHPKWAQLFPGVKEGKTTFVNEIKTYFEYELSLVVKYGPYTIPLYPKGKQTVTYAPDAVSESKILNELTNYKDYIEFLVQKTRLIPYQTGILIEDDVHLKVKNQVPAAVKSELAEFFNRYVETFRKALGGE